MSFNKHIPRCTCCHNKVDKKKNPDIRLCAIDESRYLCSNCISLLYFQFFPPDEQRKTSSNRVSSLSLKKPSIIKSYLDDHVIGQQHAKKVLSVAAYNHYKRINDTLEDDDTVIDKSNILMIGPTGSGKTLIASTLAKALDVPFISVDATAYSSTGYVGKDVEDIIHNLYQAAGENVALTEQGIVFIDEIDKICKKSSGNNIDVSGEAVQNTLLKLLEGETIDIPNSASKKPDKEQSKISISTKNILFICGGAFSGIEEANKINIGYNSTENKTSFIFENITPDDLFHYGFKQEFIGRLPIIATLEPLSKEALIDILIKPKNSIIKQYKKLLAYDKVSLEFTVEALQKIASKALEKNIGARALRSILEELMLDIMFKAPDMENNNHVKIDEDQIK